MESLDDELEDGKNDDGAVELVHAVGPVARRAERGAVPPSPTQVLRAFRLLRVFKLARSWKGLQAVLACLLNSVAGLSNLFLLLGLIIFIFALLGMQTFGNRFVPAAGFDEPCLADVLGWQPAPPDVSRLPLR